MLDFIIHEPADEYHARSKSGEFMSSHLLSDFRDSPLLYHRKVTGVIQDADSPAYAFGRAAHSFILEGEAKFDQEFFICDGPINDRTGEPYGKTTKAYQEWAARQTRQIVSVKDFALISTMRNSVRANNYAIDLLAQGEAEGVVRATYCGVPCQIRMDWFNPNRGLVDYKTCDSLKYFEYDCKRFGYVRQLAFYRGVINAAIKQMIPPGHIAGAVHDVYLIATEKNEPFATGVWKLSNEVLDMVEEVNSHVLDRYRECKQSNIWPTGYEEMRMIDEF